MPTISNLDMMTGVLNGLVDKYSLKGVHIDEVVGGAVVTHSKRLQSGARGGARHQARADDARHHHAAGLRHQPAGGVGSAAKIATGEIECGIAVGSDTTSDAPIVVQEEVRAPPGRGAEEDDVRRAEGVQGLLAGRAGAAAAQRRRAAHRACRWASTPS